MKLNTRKVDQSMAAALTELFTQRWPRDPSIKNNVDALNVMLEQHGLIVVPTEQWEAEGFDA